MHHPFVKLALAAASSSTRVNWSRCAAYAHACLECLRAKLQERGADGSLDEFRMSLADFPWKVALPAALCLALLAMAKQLLHPSRNQPVSPLQFTQALLRFIVPGGSVWPARYARMPVSRGVASLGYGALVRDLVNGVVELRSTRYARLLVLCSPFDLGVCVVSFRMELRMWTSAICFLLKNELPFQTFKQLANLATAAPPPKASQNSRRVSPHRVRFLCDPRGRSSTPAQQLLLGSPAFFSLDSVPRVHAERAIHTLKRCLPAGGSALLTFTTTTSSRPSLVTKRGVLISMLFAHSTPLLHENEHYSSLPLYSTLSDILSLLSLGTDNHLTVDVVRNNSMEYAQSLRDSSARGLPPGRRVAVLRLLEAELYELGWFARWEVLVTKRHPTGP